MGHFISAFFLGVQMYDNYIIINCFGRILSPSDSSFSTKPQWHRSAEDACLCLNDCMKNEFLVHMPSYLMLYIFTIKFAIKYQAIMAPVGERCMFTSSSSSLTIRFAIKYQATMAPVGGRCMFCLNDYTKDGFLVHMPSYLLLYIYLYGMI